MFTTVDLSYGLLSFSYPYYITLFASGILSYYLCTIHKQTLGAIVGLLASDLVIFVFATDKDIMDGSLLLYIPAVLAAFVLFDSKRFVLRIIFCCIAFALFFAARNVDWDVFSYGPEPTLKYPVTFIIDFCVSLLLSILLLQFVAKINTKVEKKLLAHQEELKKLSVNLKKNETRLLLANKGSRIGVYEWNIVTNEVYTSNEWLSLLGYESQGSNGSSADLFLEMAHPDDRKMMMTVIKRYQHLSEPFEMEVRRKTISGEYIWCLDRGMVTKQNGEELDLIVGTTMDINERKINELAIQDQIGKLQITNRELDSFVYNASHDLRSPLSSILGLLSIASSSDSLEELKVYLTYMEKSVKVLDEFILAISTYTQNSKQQITTERVELSLLLQEVLDSLRYNSWYKNIEIISEITEGIVIETDKSRLRIVLSNLIANAIKYRDQRKETQFVRIKVENIADGTHILIEDNGIGIDNAYLERVFDMFYRAQSSVEGSGLGLYITSEIITKINGRLFLSSVLEEGTAIKVILPQKLLM